VVDRAHAAGAAHVGFSADAADAVRQAVETARPGDRVLVLGAGDVWKLAEEVLKGLRRQDAVAGERS
jgi:UDP-N-acetylmuramate--alanine ligase